MTEDEIVGWHHRLNGHEFEKAPGHSDGQGGLVCCSPWGCKESETTERLHFLSSLRADPVPLVFSKLWDLGHVTQLLCTLISPSVK